MATVLVCDGEQRAALAATRSLGRRGHTVYVCSPRAASLAAASRFARGSAAVPDALAEPDAFSDAVEGLVRRWGVDVLLPIAEPSLLALLPRRDRFPGVRIPFPDHERFLRICDKEEVAEAALRAGIRVPGQTVLQAPGDREALRGCPPRFPVVVKPARSVVGTEEGRVKTAVAHADGWPQLEQALDVLPAGAYPVLLQERVVGPGVGIFVLLSGGRAAAAFAHRRIREKPPSGGVSVLRESIPLQEDLLERSCELLRGFGWEGVAMVEYKLDAATGTPYIMEINGRLWGSLQLAVDAGVDFPALLVEGAGDAPRPSYRPHVRSRWEWGDVDHLIARLRRTPAELSLPSGAPGRARAVWDFLKGFGPGARDEVFRLDDPRPFLRETVDWVRRR